MKMILRPKELHIISMEARVPTISLIANGPIALDNVRGCQAQSVVRLNVTTFRYPHQFFQGNFQVPENADIYSRQHLNWRIDLDGDSTKQNIGCWSC